MNDVSNKTAVAIVGDFRYLYKYFSNLYYKIRNVGNYAGDIVIITSYFCPTFLIPIIKKSNNISVLRFKKIKFTKSTEKILSELKTHPDPNRHKTKNFQWHKLHLFDSKLKKWRFIFYLDINMQIHHDINIILNNFPDNSLLARADSYPKYNWKLESQFDKSNTLYKNLSKKYDLSINDYFQTGVMYFDTNIINEKTKNKIIDLVNKYPISKSNEQGILNLYFIYENNIYKELPPEVNEYITYFYWLVENKKIIITKATTTQTK